MDDLYRLHYRALFERHWWWRARTDLVTQTVRRLCTNPAETRILDVGCGDGLFFDRLSAFGDVEGVELPVAVDPGSMWRTRIHTCPFDDSFQPGKRYSLILMLDVLEHLADPQDALRNVRRLLLDDGVLLATVPAFRALWTTHDVLNQHVTRYTRKTLGRLIEGSGLQVSEHRYLFQSTGVAKLVVRAAEAVLRTKPAVPRIPPKWINESLYAFCRWEHKSLRGLPIVFGSSLLVLAKKKTGAF